MHSTHTIFLKKRQKVAPDFPHLLKREERHELIDLSSNQIAHVRVQELVAQTEEAKAAAASSPSASASASAPGPPGDLGALLMRAAESSSAEDAGKAAKDKKGGGGGKKQK